MQSISKGKFVRNDWVINNGIFVPSHSLPPVVAKKPSDSGFALYIPYSELFGDVITEEEIIRIMSNFRLSDSVTTASRLGVIIENHGHFNIRIQSGLVTKLYPKEIALKINSILFGSSDRFLFFEQQLLNIIKIGLLYGSTKPVKSFRKHGEIFTTYLTKAVLGITDHLENDYKIQEQSVDKTNRGKLVETMISMVVRNVSFNSSDQFRYLIGRYYQLFFIIPNKLKRSVNHIDLNYIFKKATGFDLWSYYSLGFAVLGQFSLVNIDKDKLDPNKFFINKRLFFGNIQSNKRRAVRFLNRLSFTPNEFRSEFPNEFAKTKNFYYSFLIFRNKPLICLSNTLFFVSNLRFLKEKITSGIFWEIADSLPKEEKNKYFRFVGEIYEEYIKNVFRRMYRVKNILTKRYSFEIKYLDHRQEKKTSDVIVSYGNKIIVVEAKAARPKMIDTCVLGDLKSFRDDLDKMVYHGSKEIDRVINDWKQNLFSVPNINIDDKTCYYPLIITLGSIPQVDLIWQEEINKELKQRGYFTDPRIRQLQLIDTEELEMLEPLIKSGHNLIDILDSKINNPEFVYKPMKNFLLHSFYNNMVESPNSYLHREFGKISKKLRETLFGSRS